MPDSQQPTETIKPIDLRGILKYVPKFQNQTFVIAIDGRIIDHPAFTNILLDIAVLRNLHINIILIYGIGTQLREHVVKTDAIITDSNATKPVDSVTLEIATQVSSQVSHKIMQGLTKLGIKCASTNAVRATPAGILKGIDQQHRGKVERVDSEQLLQLISNRMIPVIAPLAFDRQGENFRLDSDHLATEVALASMATKILFLSSQTGLTINGKFIHSLELEALKQAYSTQTEQLTPRIRKKCKHAIRALEGGVSRVHILDGLMADSILNEVFSSAGVGTLFYNNDYQQIRWARTSDAQTIFDLSWEATQSEELAPRTLSQIESLIDTYFVYEIDGYVLGCGSLIDFHDNLHCELASLLIKSSQAGKGIGRKLVKFAEEQTLNKNATRLLALSTQAYTFFTQKCGFTETTTETLPTQRAEKLQQSGRNSRILVKELTA